MPVTIDSAKEEEYKFFDSLNTKTCTLGKSCLIIWCRFCSPPNIMPILFTTGMKDCFAIKHSFIKIIIIKLNFIYHVHTKFSLSPSLKAYVSCSLYGLNTNNLCNTFHSVGLGIFSSILMNWRNIFSSIGNCSVITLDSGPVSCVLHNQFQ